MGKFWSANVRDDRLLFAAMDLPSLQGTRRSTKCAADCNLIDNIDILLYKKGREPFVISTFIVFNK